MTVGEISREEQRRKGYKHPSNQPGWTKNSFKPATTPEEANYLGDEEYHDSLGVHNPLWRYVIKRYTKESETPILVVGYDALPVAIELSQWTYPVVFVVKNKTELEKAKYDIKRQAGFFKDTLTLPFENYLGGYPHSRVAIFIGIIDKMDNDGARIFIDNLKKSATQIICAVKPNRNWKDTLGKSLIDSLSYYKGRFNLLRIE